MITNDFRPQTFKEVAGQKLNKKILKSIVREPKGKPQSIILQGQWGTGKTTIARIIARALNCERGGAEPCMKCNVCKEDIQSSPFYQEYDSAIIGNVNKIRDLRDTFHYSIVSGWKVVVFDEAHLASKQAQSALLKVIEEAPAKVFFVFCTTDVEKMLSTIRSRSLELRFELVQKEDVVKNLKKIIEIKEIEIEDKILELIALRSRGHMRNAHMYLDQYIMIGETDFKQAVRTSKQAILNYFYGLGREDEKLVFKSIDEILTFPLADIRMDFQQTILDLTKVLVGVRKDEKEKKVVQALGGDTIKIVKQSMSEWVINSFDSDMTLESFLLALYQLVGSTKGNKKKTKKSRYNRARKK